MAETKIFGVEQRIYLQAHSIAERFKHPDHIFVSDVALIAQALAAEHSALSSLESAMAHIKASGHCGSAIMSVPQILAWAREIGWQG